MFQADCNVAGCKNKAITLALMRPQPGQVSEVAFCNTHARHLDGGFIVPNPEMFTANQDPPAYVECRLWAVFFVYDDVLSSIVLKGIDGKSAFVVHVGYAEACSIYHAMKGGPYPSPPTHALIGTLVQTLGGSLIEAVVESFDRKSQAYKCHLAVRTRDGVVNVACRGSDAVALTLFTNIPIRVNSSLLGTTLGADADLLN